ncbi:MAG: hypothetical protein IH996_03020 [Proteobacteria bacterium]|nr:hypothetical protein [Pseudomonadota bacterium]
MKFVAVFAAVLAGYADFDPQLAIYFAVVSSLLAAWTFPDAVLIAFGVILYNFLAALFPSEQFLIFDIFGQGFAFEDGPEINFWIIGFHVFALILGFARLGARGR